MEWQCGAAYTTTKATHSEPPVLLSAGSSSALPSQYHVSTGSKGCYDFGLLYQSIRLTLQRAVAVKWWGFSATVGASMKIKYLPNIVYFGSDSLIRSDIPPSLGSDRVYDRTRTVQRGISTSPPNTGQLGIFKY